MPHHTNRFALPLLLVSLYSIVHGLHWEHHGGGGKQLFTRDELEVLSSINEAYVPSGGTGNNLFDQMTALIDQAVELKRARMVYDAPHYEDDGEEDVDDEASHAGARQSDPSVYEHPVEDDEGPAPPADIYAPFQDVFDDSVQFVDQPRGHYFGLVRTVDALVDDADLRMNDRTLEVVGLRRDHVSMHQAGLLIVRSVETYELAPQGATQERRILDVFFLHIREKRMPDTLPGHPEVVKGKWVIHLIERLPAVYNPQQMPIGGFAGSGADAGHKLN